ncbi:MAG TPA: P22 phage major capsid protein family protein [Patescibacteria group bacterium]|nr:P22 phage major capsid protein family protein [Patescibacteria group bacterium]
MSTILTQRQIVETAIGLLLRESVLPRIVTRDAVGGFPGGGGDTVTIRMPAFAPARNRAVRAGAARVRDSIHERPVNVTLADNIYKDVRVSDAVFTLDVSSFGRQFLAPVVSGIVRGLEDSLATTILGATYHQTFSFSLATTNAWNDVIVPARERLNLANVPMDGRYLAVGAAVETSLLRDARFTQATDQGSEALTEASLGRKAGFTIVSVPRLPPDTAIALHRTAFVMAQRAPLLPAGATGDTIAQEGFALRVVRVMDSATVEDILVVDSFSGQSAVLDAGYFTAAGQFVPAEPVLAPAIGVTGVATTDIFTSAVAHGFAVNDRVVFPTLTGGTGLVANREYFVIAANLAATTFQVSATLGGAAFNFTTDVTATSTVRAHGNDLFVRAVRITGT